MYGWDLCAYTNLVAEKACKEPWKLANMAMVTYKPPYLWSTYRSQEQRTNPYLMERLNHGLKQAESPPKNKKNI